jgi:hypothetical protein
LNRKRPGEFVLNTPIRQTFPDIDSGLKPDVLYLKGGPKKLWVWDLKPFHPNGATPKEVRKVNDYIDALKTRCFKKGPPRFVVPVEHTYVGDIDDFYNPGSELKVYASPGYENGILTYTLEREDFDDDFWDRIKDVKPQDIPWFIFLPIIFLTPIGL